MDREQSGQSRTEEIVPRQDSADFSPTSLSANVMTEIERLNTLVG